MVPLIRHAFASIYFVALLSGCVILSTERQINYGLNHYKMGLFNHAIPPLVSAAESLEKKSPPDPRLVEVLIALGEMAASTKRNDLAADFFPRALKAAEALKPQDNVRLRNSLVHLGNFYLAGRAAEAVPLLTRAEVISRTLEDQVLHAIDQDNLALAYQGTKDYARANALSLQALETLKNVKTGNLVPRTKGIILYNLGYSHMETGRYKEAEAHFKESLALLQSDPAGVESWRVKTVIKAKADLFRRTGRNKEADDLEKQVRVNAL